MHHPEYGTKYEDNPANHHGGMCENGETNGWMDISADIRHSVDKTILVTYSYCSLSILSIRNEQSK